MSYNDERRKAIETAAQRMTENAVIISDDGASGWSITVHINKEKRYSFTHITEYKAEKIAALMKDFAVFVALARERASIEQSPEIKTLKEIARLTNLYLGGSCCEEHHRATGREINRLLGLFEDDGFERLKDRALLPPDAATNGREGAGDENS